MPFRSFVPESVKRGLVLGVAALVDTSTLPVDMKPMALTAKSEASPPLLRILLVAL